MRTLALTILLASTIWCQAVVPPIQSVTLAWDSVTNTTVELYKLYEISGPATNLLATTTNLTVTLTNVLAMPHRWFVTASNMWGESDPSNLLVVPGAPVPPTNLKPISTSLVVPVPGLIEGTTDLEDWDTKLRVAGPVGEITLTQIVQPKERLMFWRSRQWTAARPPLPQ
jgi:hypothetical protein